MEKMRDISSPVKFSLEESTNLPPGVLSKVKGPFFFPGGLSRNERFYPNELWEAVVNQPRIKEKLDNLVMYGTVFHPKSEPSIEEYSHVVTNLWIDSDPLTGKRVGMGEAYILDTPRGKVLNTFLKLGSRWCVSSRASGTYIPGRKTESGAQIVDPESFQLETFDFTPDPGFLDAHPKLVESLERPTMEKIIMEDFSMEREINEEVFKSLVRENKRLKEDLEKSFNDNNAYEYLGKPEEIKEALESGKQIAKTLREYARYGSVADVKQLKIDSKLMKESLDKYRKLGTRKAITEVLNVADKAAQKLAAYQEIGSIKDIKEVYSRSVKLAEISSQYRKLGIPSDIQEAFGKTKTALDMLKTYKKIGTVNEIQESYKKVLEMVKLLDKYRKFGKPGEIKESYTKMAEFVTKYKKKNLQSKASLLAKEFNVSESTVLALVESIPVESKLRKALSRLSESNKETRLALFESDEKKSEVVNDSAISKIARNL
jgi:hypothetical protein